MRLLEILLFTLGGVWQGVRQDFNLLEIAIIVGLAYAWRRGWRPERVVFPHFERPWLAAVVLALGFVALRIALIPLLPVPVPIVTDEFSHLLLADTLMHGRVANPVHPYWPFFESLHILMRPRYVSAYFPGQALWLAAGRMIVGSAWAGILAQCGVFLLALYWMLRGWMPPKWALFGVLLAGLRFAIASYWVNAYHGGFFPAIGGALVAGAFARLQRRSTVLEGLVFGVGLAILAATRPMEGALYSLPFAGVLAWEFRRNIAALAVSAVPVVLCVAALGAYSARITGSPFVTPYQIEQKTYGWPRSVAFFKAPPVVNANIEFARYYDYEVSEHEKVSNPLNFVQYLTFHVEEYWRFFLGPALTVPLLMIGRVWKRRPMLLIAAGVGLGAVMLEGAASPHYLAAATAVIIAIVVECCRHMEASGVYISKFMPLAMALVLTLRIGAQSLGLPYTQKLNFQTWCCRVQGNQNKARITALMDTIPGNHLVFVQTKTDENNLLQWIYNDADIDASRIVWARDLGPGPDADLVKYYAGRRDVWMVNPNVEPATCVKYPLP